MSYCIYYFCCYHLADIMSRVVLLCGEQALLDEYNKRVDEKLNTNSSVKEGKSTKPVGFTRGIQLMMNDIVNYDPHASYLGEHTIVGGLFDAKKEFYRLISLLLSDLGLIFNIRYPSPCQVISDLQTRGIIDIGESESVDIKVCLSIANEIRLKTYFANNGQKELFSPVSQNTNTTEQSADVPIFRDFDENVLVRLLSISNEIRRRCIQFILKYNDQDDIDVSLLNSSCSKATQLGYVYARLQNFRKALKWMKSVPEDSPDYINSLVGQGLIYFESGEFDKAAECLEEALKLHDEKGGVSNLKVVECLNGLAAVLMWKGEHEKSITKLEKAIHKQSEIYGEGPRSAFLIGLLVNRGYCYHMLDDEKSAVKTFKDALKKVEGLTNVPKQTMIALNLFMALSLSCLDEHSKSLKYLEQGLKLSNEAYGEGTPSASLALFYKIAGDIHDRCNQDNEAVSFFNRSLKLYHRLGGNKPHPGKIIT